MRILPFRPKKSRKSLEENRRPQSLEENLRVIESWISLSTLAIGRLRWRTVHGLAPDEKMGSDGNTHYREIHRLADGVGIASLCANDLLFASIDEEMAANPVSPEALEQMFAEAQARFARLAAKRDN